MKKSVAEKKESIPEPIIIPVKDPRLTKLYSKKVFPPWYRRYEFTLPEEEQINFQPPAEVDARNELLAMLFVWGEDWEKSVAEDPGKRYTAMKKYAKYQEEKQRASIYEVAKLKTQSMKDSLSATSVLLGYKKKTDMPTERQMVFMQRVIRFMNKMQLKKFRAIKPKRPLQIHSKWRVLQMPMAKRKLHVMAVNIQIEKVRRRFKRIISLVRCVQRFIVNISILSGNTKQIFSDLVKFQVEQQERLNKEVGDDKSKRESKARILFNPKKYIVVKNLSLDVSVRFTLTKPWFERKEKEILEVVDSLQSLRSYVAQPLHAQRLIAKAAWYLEIPEDKVIIRECHIAQDYYMVISGRCTICKLNGSPFEAEKAGFRFVRHCFKGDIFGEETILDPGSMRTYSVISSTACEILAINIHDYHKMLLDNSDREDEDELEPEHIRCLYNLTFLRDFPVNKIMDDGDGGNLSVFYVEPNTLVCNSIKESQFVYVIKHGRATLLVERPPSAEVIAKYNRLKDVWDEDTTCMRKRLGQSAMSSCRSSLESAYRKSSGSYKLLNVESSKNVDIDNYLISIPMDVKQHVIRRVHKKDNQQTGATASKTISVSEYLASNIELMPFGRRDMKFKQQTEVRRMPEKKSQKTILTLQRRLTEIAAHPGPKTSPDISEYVSSRNSPQSSNSDVSVPEITYDERTATIKASMHGTVVTNRNPTNSDRILARLKDNQQSNLNLNSSNLRKSLNNRDIRPSKRPNVIPRIDHLLSTRDKLPRSTFTKHKTVTPTPTSQINNVRNDASKINTINKSKLNVGNNIRNRSASKNLVELDPEKLSNVPELRRSKSNKHRLKNNIGIEKKRRKMNNICEDISSLDKRVSAIRSDVSNNTNGNHSNNQFSSRHIFSSNTSQKQNEGNKKNYNVFRPVNIRASDVANALLVTGRSIKDTASNMSDFKSIQPYYKPIDPSILMNRKEWSKFLVYKNLEKGDQAGYEWLDFKDRPYDPPEHDCALVSDGCEFILLKKEYILSKMKKFWMTEDLINQPKDSEDGESMNNDDKKVDEDNEDKRSSTNRTS